MHFCSRCRDTESQQDAAASSRPEKLQLEAAQEGRISADAEPVQTEEGEGLVADDGDRRADGRGGTCGECTA